MNFSQVVVPVDRFGLVDCDRFAAVCNDQAVLASIMYANNEVGTIEPIWELGRIARDKSVLFHTDAVQAVGQLPIDVQALNVDMMSISAHKFYGPKGVGALYVREGVELVPSQSGGNHENGRRAGTHNTPLIVGMAKALELAYEEFDARNEHYQSMRDQLIDGVLSRVKNARLTGHPEHRLASHASFTFDGIDSNVLLMHLDVNGIAASGGSACKTGNPKPSDVLMALGYSEREALGGLRLTVGQQTTAEDIEYTIRILAEVVDKLYKLVRV
jgi:cysteine desulfurase